MSPRLSDVVLRQPALLRSSTGIGSRQHWGERYSPLPAGVFRGSEDLPSAREVLSLPSTLAPFFGTRGLWRGSTVVVAAGRGQGATSLALSLCAGATRDDLWTGVLNLTRAGLVGAVELGVALDHVAIVPHPIPDVGAAASALMEACAVVLLGADFPVAPHVADRLQRRAREHHCVLLVLASPTGHARNGVSMSRWSSWPGIPDVFVEVTGSSIAGMSRGPGRFLQRHMSIEVTCRRNAVPVSHHVLSLPDNGMLHPGEWEMKSSPQEWENRVG